jgi:hypothetical protein
MISDQEYLELCARAQLVTPPAVLDDYRTAWNKPEMAGEHQGVKNAREIKARSPVKFMEQMAVLEGKYLAAVQAALELEKARLPAQGARAEPSVQIPDEGSARLREIGEQVLRQLGLKVPGDEDPGD